MATLLVDVNLDGHAELLAMRLATDAWRELRDHLDIRFLQFEDVGLARTAKDDVVWRLCQERGYFLLTANRNEDSEDSLEATLRREGTIESLPVLTFRRPANLPKPCLSRKGGRKVPRLSAQSGKSSRSGPAFSALTR